MQEEIENKTLTLIISGTKFSGRLMKTAICKFVASQKEHRIRRAQKKQRDGPVVHHGKQTVKQLTGQNQGVTNVEVNDRNTRAFERVARKYGVDYAVKRVKGSDPPKYMIFFKARDDGAINAAFAEYTAKKVRKATRQSVRKKLRLFSRLANKAPRKEKKKVRER